MESGLTCDMFMRIPFVTSPCSYLAGVFSPSTPPAVKASYLQAVSDELQGFTCDIDRPPAFRSITLGGGALTTIEPASFDLFAEGLQQRLGRPACPFAATVDPGLLSSALLCRFAAFGIDRCIIRFMSSDPMECERLGMPCSEIEMRKTYRVLECGPAMLIDMQVLIGIPGQTPATLMRTLEDARALGASHFELLAYEGADAALESRLRTTARLFACASKWMESQGFTRYTATCFAAQGAERVAELHRFEGDAELGIGVGCASAFDGMLWENTSDIDTYILNSSDPAAITGNTAIIDERITRLRRQFFALYHLMPLPATPDLQTLIGTGLLARDDDKITLSDAGALHYRTAFSRLPF